jgi:parallel beta-helix repeat protein
MTGYCINLYESEYNLIRNNYITGDDNGIRLEYWSNYNTIANNSITNNSQVGLSVEMYSEHNMIHQNTISKNGFGFYVISSTQNTIWQNNIADNDQQAYVSVGSVDNWDAGYPSGGNYWSNYTGVDLNRDGIGDSWLEIDEINTDHYPLMGMFDVFDTTLGYDVNVISNSTIQDFQYYEYNNTILMHVYNMTVNQTFGFVRICIPHALMNETFQVTIDGAEPYYVNYTLCDNGTHRWIYFSYQHSTHEIIIVPEFPSLLILPLFILATLLAVIVYKREQPGYSLEGCVSEPAWFFNAKTYE